MKTTTQPPAAGEAANRYAPMKPRDLALLLNRAAAVIEDPKCETKEERMCLVEDLVVEAERIVAEDEDPRNGGASFDASRASAAIDCNAELSRQFFSKALEADKLRDALSACYESLKDLSAAYPNDATFTADGYAEECMTKAEAALHSAQA